MTPISTSRTPTRSRRCASTSGRSRGRGRWRATPGVLNEAGGRIAFRFHARDVNLVMGPASRGASVPFRVFLDGQPAGAAAGVDVDAERRRHRRRPADLPADPPTGPDRGATVRDRVPRRRRRGVLLHVRLKAILWRGSRSHRIPARADCLAHDGAVRSAPLRGSPDVLPPSGRHRRAGAGRRGAPASSTPRRPRPATVRRTPTVPRQRDAGRAASRCSSRRSPARCRPRPPRSASGSTRAWARMRGPRSRRSGPGRRPKRPRCGRTPTTTCDSSSRGATRRSGGSASRPSVGSPSAARSSTSRSRSMVR